MLQAKTIEGEYTMLATMKKEKIDLLKNKKVPFYCPVCNKQVIIKAGTKMIAHFAHQSISDCPSSEGGEGMYHEQGKLLLYEWLKKHTMDVKLEAYIPVIQQRPDILIELNQKKIAIEFQCTRISSNVIRERTEGYKSIGITPIWILGATHFTRYKANTFKVDHFIRQAIHQFTSVSPQTIYFFDPYTSQLAVVHDIFITKNTQAIGKITISSLQKLTFSDLFQKISLTNKELLHLWKVEKRQFRLRTGVNLHGEELLWRRWLYSKGYHPEQIPSIILLPVASQYMMKIPLWNWQSKICLEIIDSLPIGHPFNTEMCRRILRRKMLNTKLFPLIGLHHDPIDEYLNTLESLNILKRVSSTSYQKIQSFQFYKNVEDAISGDTRLLQQLFLNKSDKIQA